MEEEEENECVKEGASERERKNEFVLHTLGKTHITKMDGYETVPIHTFITQSIGRKQNKSMCKIKIDRTLPYNYVGPLHLVFIVIERVYTSAYV